MAESIKLLRKINSEASNILFPPNQNGSNQINNIKRTKYSIVTKEELIAKYPTAREAFKKTTPIVSIEERIQDNDEKTQTWSEMYRFAAFYYDNPLMHDRYKFLEALKFNFSGILSQTENPYELPNLSNRRSLINWVCQQHNSFLRLKNSENSVECNVDVLLNVYGPNYNGVKSFMGAQEFFF